MAHTVFLAVATVLLLAASAQAAGNAKGIAFLEGKNVFRPGYI
jgi:hypothetical protein